MGLRLLRRCEVWCPTWSGWFVIGALLIIPLTWWFAFGESFLALTQRYPAEVLVVEGWIGRDGVRAAEAEFQRLGYQYIVATGNPEHEGWEDPLSSYAEMTERELIRSGVPSDRIIVASARDTQRQRTYESAVAAQRALQAKGIRPQALNVFTKGPHARRSRLVFAKILGRPRRSELLVGARPAMQPCPGGSRAIGPRIS